jgi:ATP-dependent DNA ligase
VLALEDGKARAFTRNGHDWTGRYAPITKACAGLRCRSALIGGAVIVEDEHGVCDFDALPYTIRHYPDRLVFFAFDLLHFDGIDLRRRPHVERRTHLLNLVRRGCFEIRQWWA